MWIVAKIDTNKIYTLKNEFLQKLGSNVKFYAPKLKLKKFMNSKIQTKESYLLGNYILCFHEEFKKKSILTSLNYCKGLKYFLSDLYSSQKEILDFICKCKENEDNNGFLQQSFFDYEGKTKYEFISGPFTNLIFTLLSQNKIYINASIGKYKISVSKADNFFRPA
jgi:hypothetical protein